MSASAATNSTPFDWNQGVTIGSGSLLLITGVVLLALGASGILGSLKGIGAISSMALGGIDTLFVLVIAIVVSRHKIARAFTSTTSAASTFSKEELKSIKWHCSSRTSQEMLGSLYQSNNELCCGVFKNFQPEPGDKLVLVVNIDGRMAYTTYGEENSPEYLFLNQFQETLGERLLVLFDIVDAKSHCTKDPKEMLRNQPVWDPIFSSNRFICTNEPNWREKLHSFIRS